MRDKIDNVVKWGCVILLGVLVIDVLWQVFGRYILASPSSFTDEIAGFLLIWVGLLGAAFVAGKNEHLAIDLIVQNASPKRAKTIKTIIQILIALFSLSVLVVGGTWLVYTRFMLNVKSAALSIPLGYVYTVLPISGILILYYSIDNLVKLKNNID